MRFTLDLSNPWHLEQILLAMPDDRRVSFVMYLTPMASWLLLSGLYARSPQLLLCGLVLVLAALASAPPGFAKQSFAVLFKFFTCSFALILLFLVPFSVPFLFGFTKFGIVVRLDTLVAFEAIGALLCVSAWAVWVVGYVSFRGSRAA